MVTKLLLNFSLLAFLWLQILANSALTDPAFFRFQRFGLPRQCIEMLLSVLDLIAVYQITAVRVASRRQYYFSLP